MLSGIEKEKKSFRKKNDDGNSSFTFGDRRSELVFINQDLNHGAFQKVLNACLMTDEEFSMLVDEWKQLGLICFWKNQ